MTAFEGSALRQSNTSLRVGIVTTSFPVPGHASSGIFVERLVAKLGQIVDVTVLIPGSDSVQADIDPEKPYRVQLFAYGPRAWMRITHRPGGIPDALRRRDPAILLLLIFIPAMFLAAFRLAGRVDVMHGNWSFPGLISGVAARLRGRLAIVTLRGEDVTRARVSWLYRAILKSCLALNHRTVVVSEAMRDELHRRHPARADQIVFIPNGVAIDTAVARTSFHAPIRLITVGSLIRRKQFATLIRALASPGAPAQCILRVVGDGPERRSLEILATELGVRRRVEFVGSIPPSEVGLHLAWGDVFVFASESEGRPNSVLEAMAAGLPIVATDIPGVRELVYPDAGLLYPVGDASGLADAIESLVASETTATGFGITAQARVQSSGMTWTASAENYFDLYRDAYRGMSNHTCAE